MDEEAAAEVAALWGQVEQIRHQALRQMARLYARGQVAGYSGYSTLAKWLTHHGAMPTAQAKDLARLAQHTHTGSLPTATAALEAGELVLGEAVAVAKATEKAVQTRDEQRFPDQEAYQGLFESALVAGKRPALSVNQIQSLARHISFRLDPHRLDRQHEQAHAGRGMSLHETFQGSYQLQAWGGVGDALIFRAAVEAFSQTPEEGQTRSRSERDHDALVAALKFATTHTGCATTPAPLAQIRIIVPVQTYLDTGPGRRLASAKQRAAAFHGHTTCARPGGCEVPIAYCQADHITSFSQGGKTVVGNLQPLCGPHNRAKYQCEKRERHRQQQALAALR